MYLYDKLNILSNLDAIATGSGNATVEDVLKGKTFTNNDGVEYTGTLELTGDAAAANVLKDKTFYSTDTKTKLTGSMTNNSDTTKSATGSLDATNKRVQLAVPANAYYNTSSKLYIAYSTLASLIGLTAAKIVSGNTILGIAGTATVGATSLSGSFTTAETAYTTTGTVTFEKAFGAIPTVIATAVYTTTNQAASITISNVSKGGFTYTVTNTTGTPYKFKVTWNASTK